MKKLIPLAALFLTGCSPVEAGISLVGIAIFVSVVLLVVEAGHRANDAIDIIYRSQK